MAEHAYGDLYGLWEPMIEGAADQLHQPALAEVAEVIVFAIQAEQAVWKTARTNLMKTAESARSPRTSTATPVATAVAGCLVG